MHCADHFLTMRLPPRRNGRAQAMPQISRAGRTALGMRRSSRVGSEQNKQEQIDAVLAQVQEQGLETIRVCFVDQHGILRGKTIVASALQSAFEAGIGVPSTLLLKDTFHRTVFPVWSEGASIADLPLAGAGDVLIHPDPTRFFPLPWSPH